MMRYTVDWFNCKHCGLEFTIRIPYLLDGDALIVCPMCGWRHPRQFASGVAVSCNPPSGKYVEIH